MRSLFVLLLFSAGLVCGQNVTFKKGNFPGKESEFKKALSAKKTGDHFYELGTHSYAAALEEFQIAQSFNPANAELNYRMGICLLNSVRFKEAFPFFDMALELDAAVAEDIYLQLGRAHHLGEDWDNAVKYYEEYKVQLTSLSEKLRNEQLVIVNKRIKECGYGKVYTQNPHKVEITHLGEQVNSPYPEYFAVINADESVMMYTSPRPGTTGEVPLPEGQEYTFHMEDIYVSKRSEDGSWANAEGIGPPVNTGGNDATLTLSPDGHSLIMYKDDEGNGDLYMTRLVDGGWQNPEKLNSNVNTKHHECAGSFSFDQRSLFFVSDRPDGSFGGHDIFVSHWDDSTNAWGVAHNLGSTVNTSYNELSVFAHPDGRTLFFSSEGHTSMGGYDIFKSELDSAGHWGEPENVGYPLNTAGNDAGLIMSASGKHGYVTAYREESLGKEDVYMVTFPDDEIEEHVTLLKGHVRDAETKEYIFADIRIFDVAGDSIVSHLTSDSKSGHFLITLPAGRNYAIEIESENHLFHSEHFDIPATDEYREIEKEIYMDPIKVGEKVVLNNIFFDIGLSTLRPESNAELEELVKFATKNADVGIEIDGHTDDVGNNADNLKLSEDRAHAVVDYLVAAGVSKNRLKYAGFGETLPVASNETEEGRQLNRRTEMKIVSIGK